MLNCYIQSWNIKTGTKKIQLQIEFILKCIMAQYSQYINILLILSIMESKNWTS
jgi:hypothetical protein